MRWLLLVAAALLGCYAERVEIDLDGDLCRVLREGAARLAVTVKVGATSYGAPLVLAPQCSFHVEAPCPSGAPVVVRVAALDGEGRYGEEATLTGRCDDFSRVAQAGSRAANAVPAGTYFAVTGAGDEVVMVGADMTGSEGVVATFDGVSFAKVPFSNPPGPLRHVWIEPRTRAVVALGDGNHDRAAGILRDGGPPWCGKRLPGSPVYAGVFAGKLVLRDGNGNFGVGEDAAPSCESPSSKAPLPVMGGVAAFGPSGEPGVWINGATGEWTRLPAKDMAPVPSAPTLGAKAVTLARDYACIITKKDGLSCPLGPHRIPTPMEGIVKLFATPTAVIALTAQGALYVCPIGGTQCSAKSRVPQGTSGVWASARTLWLVGEPGVVRFDLRTLLSGP